MMASWILALVAALTLSVANGQQNLAKQVCSADNSILEHSYNSADVIFGVSLSVRNALNGDVKCGKPSGVSMQFLEAVRFAVNYINNFDGGRGFIPDVTFGMKVHDSCHSGINGLADLQKLFPRSTAYQYGPDCTANSNKAMLGMVGPFYSSVADQVAAYAKDIPTTILSPSAVASSLSDTTKYPTFFRTVPSVAEQMRAVASVLDQYDWRKVIVLNTDDSYGKSGFDNLIEASRDYDICVSKSVQLSVTGTVEEYKTILQSVGSNDFIAGVISSADEQARMLLQAVQQIPELQRIHWILIDVGLDIPVSEATLRQMKGAFAVLPKSLQVDQFRDYFVGLLEDPRAVTDNPWFKEWYEEVNQCSLNVGSPNACVLKDRATLQSEFKQNPYVMPIIKAVFAYAKAFDTLCGAGRRSCALTRAAWELQDILRQMDYTFPSNILGGALTGEHIKFDANGDKVSGAFTVFQYNNFGGSFFSFKDVGEYKDGALTVRNTLFYNQDRSDQIAQAPTSLCGLSGCASCIYPPNMVNYQYTPGDLVIASLVNGHSPSNSLFNCGPDMEKRFASMVAAQWAIGEYKRRNPSKLQGVSLGSLVADVCPTGAVAAGFLNNLFSSSSVVLDKDGLAISSRRNIYGFVDDTDNMMAKMISPILSQYKYAEIQTGATTPYIHSGDMYPYFSRAVPSEEMYMKALTSLLQAKFWNHVQVVTMKNVYHSASSMKFKAFAARHGICVVSTSYLDDGASEVLTKLLSDSSAFAVVVFGHAENIKELFDQIKSTSSQNKIQVISGMSEWGTDPRYFDTTSSDPDNTITLGLRTRKNSDFENYLQGLSQTQISTNSFLTSLFEVTNKCSLTSTSRGRYSRICSTSDTFVPYQGNSPYMIQGIYNVADKLHELIAEICQDSNYNGLCVEFQRRHDIPERLAEKLKNSPGIINGEGSTDIVYYVINNGLYQEFGDYDTSEEHVNTLQGPNANLLNTRFNRGTSCPGSCLECQYMYTYKDVVYRPGDVIIAGSFSASSPGPVGLQPYICGDIKKKNGPLLTMAMMYALEQVNSNKAPVSVKGITFGGLALDHCGNEGRQKLMVSDIYSGFLPHVMREEGKTMDPTDIISWLTTGSPATREAAILLDPLGIPMVSPDATSESLLKDHDNFFRTIQGDTTTSNAFVKIAKQLGFRYIQVVHSDDSYGRDSKDTLVSVALSEGVCVTQTLEFSDASQASGIVDKLLKKETHVVVMIMGTTDTNTMMEAIALNNEARTSLLVMLPEPFKSTVDFYGAQMTYPPIALQLQTSTLSGFKAYLNSNPVDNIFFARFYMKLNRCNLEGYYEYSVKCTYPLAPISSSPEFEDSIFELSTINAVYASVDALDRTIKEYCDPEYTEPCMAYLQAPDQRQRFAKNLQLANFIDEGLNAFRFLQREGNVVFDVLQYSSTRFQQIEVGSYAGVSLNLGSDFENKYGDVESACTLPCLECINRGLNFSLTTGDIYLGGLFDVHQSSFNPFTCGRINTLHGFLLLEAFHYALDQVNKNKEGQFKGILNGVKLGGVGLDACGSQVRGGQLVSNINNKLTPLIKDALTVDSSQIDAYLGSYDSSSTRYLARILNDLEIPQISYAAGSTELSDQRIYPYFYRTVPSNGHQARAILAYLNEMNIRYIQVLYADNTYGISGRDELVKLAESYKICIAQTVDYPDLGIASVERSKEVVNRLMEKPSANTIVTFVGTSYVNSVLRAVGTDRARGKLRFVGSDVWADNKEAIDGAGSNPVDSVTLKLDADDVVEFESYINSKTLANSAGNPWFEEYYQEIHNCYTTAGNPYGYSSPCPQSLSSIINSGRYQQDPNVITVMNAVYASAFAIHETLTELCGDNYQSVCQAYRNNMDRRDIIRDKLADVEFEDPSGSEFSFTNREVQLNFRLNAIVSGQLQGINYQQIGTYNSKNMTINLPTAYQPSHPWHSDCDREDACAECPAIRDSAIRYAFYESPIAPPYNDAPVIVAFFDIHEQGADPYRCGKLNMAGFQQFMSFFYSVEKHFSTQIQGEQGVGAFRGIRLLAVDTCSNPTRVDQDLFGLLQGTGLCNTNFKMPQGVSISAGNIGSVIVSGDSNTMAAARLLEQLGIAYISPNAKSPLLDKKKHLARSIAPISAKMNFLAQLAYNMDWKYLDVIYEETAMGYYPFHSLQMITQGSGVCLGEPVVIGVGTNDGDIERYLSELNGRRGSKVVVLLGSKNYFKRVLSAAGRSDIVEDYIWILGSAEDMDEDYIEDISPEEMHVKIITFHTVHHKVPGFGQHVKETRYSPNTANLNNHNIPKEWFEEYFQTMKDCTMSNANKVLNVGKPECQANSLSSSHSEEDPYIINTVLATYAASEGLHQVIKNNVATASDKRLGEHREEIMEKILAATLNLDSIGVNSGGDMFEFNAEHRWWDPSYVVNYWNVDDKDADLKTDTLHELPTHDNIQSLKEHLNMSSMCMETQKQGYCGCDYSSAYTASMVNAPDYIPSSHRNYYKYEDDGDRPYDWPIWAIAVAVLTGIGLLVTLILFLILLCAYPKKGGTSVLGYMMILGIIGIYAINFAFFLSATDTVCGIRRFLMGVVYIICFAPLLIKAVDNWRYGHVEYAQRRYSGISSAFALLICAIAIVLIQCIIPIIWLILEHPEAHDYTYSDNRHDNAWCGPTDDYDLGLVLSFSFVVFIVLMTGIIAAMSYNTESNNNESRWILFASIATAGCFLVWMIVTTNAKGVYRDPTVAIANFANATILMLAIPMRKTVLMIQAKSNKDDKDSDNDKNPYADVYSESYVNPGYELSDYDQVFMEKPSEF